MLDLAEEFYGLIDALERGGADYAVVGGFAVAIWGAPRATKDIDVLARPEDLPSILDIAKTRGFTLRAFPMTFADGMQLQRVTKVDGLDSLTLDVLQVNPSLEGVWSSRRPVDTERGAVRVISREALIEMKAAAARPQDLADIQRLEEIDR